MIAASHCDPEAVLFLGPRLVNRPLEQGVAVLCVDNQFPTRAHVPRRDFPALRRTRSTSRLPRFANPLSARSGAHDEDVDAGICPHADLDDPRQRRVSVAEAPLSWAPRIPLRERHQSALTLANDVARELGQLGRSGQARARNSGQLA